MLFFRSLWWNLKSTRMDERLITSLQPGFEGEGWDGQADHRITVLDGGLFD